MIKGQDSCVLAMRTDLKSEHFVGMRATNRNGPRMILLPLKCPAA